MSNTDKDIPKRPLPGITIVGGSFNNNGKGGIKIEGGNARIIGAETNDNAGDGVSIGKDANVHIEDHTAMGNEGEGISKKTEGGKESSPKRKWLSRILEHPIISSLIVAAIIGLFGLLTSALDTDQEPPQQQKQELRK